MLKASPDVNESLISPPNVSVMDLSSVSASGMNLPKDDLRPLMVFMVGPISTIASPRSWIVVSLAELVQSTF